MKPEGKAFLVEEGGKILSNLLRMAMARPSKLSSTESTEKPSAVEFTRITTVPSPRPTATRTTITTRTEGEELDYRWECCMKHIGAAQGLLHEAFERANDEGIGEGTAEKIMEAMNQHSTMESDDLPVMLSIPEAKLEAEKLLSGIRAFRKAAWQANLPRGGGTKEDIADARLWNDILYQEAFANAKAHPGEECIRQGM